MAGGHGRLTARHVETDEAAERHVRVYVAAVEEVIADGEVHAGEVRRLGCLGVAALGRCRASVAEACVIDESSEISELVARRGVTPWAARRVREALADRERLVADGLIEP